MPQLSRPDPPPFSTLTLRPSQVNRKITYNPGLYKIFDEILVNAADNKQRDSSMDTIKVTVWCVWFWFDAETRSISPGA